MYVLVTSVVHVYCNRNVWDTFPEFHPTVLQEKREKSGTRSDYH